MFMRTPRVLLLFFSAARYTIYICIYLQLFYNFNFLFRIFALSHLAYILIYIYVCVYITRKYWHWRLRDACNDAVYYCLRMNLLIFVATIRIKNGCAEVIIILIGFARYYFSCCWYTFALVINNCTIFYGHNSWHTDKCSYSLTVNLNW